MTVDLARLEDVRTALGVSRLVSLLAGQDPTATLIALSETLTTLDAEHLRRSQSQAAALREVLNSVSESDLDDLDDLDVTIRRDAINRARAQLVRIHFVHSREIGSRLVEAETDGGGRPTEAPEKRRLRDLLGLNRYRARRLSDLATLPDSEFAGALEGALSTYLAKGREVTINGVLRSALVPGGHDPDSWSTPVEILDAARTVFGGTIGCDPASNYAAQAATVRAERWYSPTAPSTRLGPRELAWSEAHAVSDRAWKRARAAYAGPDGLAADWFSGLTSRSVWLNPPFSRGLIDAFLAKLLAEIELDAKAEAICLVNADPSRELSRRLGRVGVRCDLSSRVAFLGPDGRPVRGNQYSQWVIGVGGGLDRDAFVEAFSPLGDCYQLATISTTLHHARRWARQSGRGPLWTAADQAIAEIAHDEVEPADG